MDVKIETAVLELPTGAVTAGVRRGARRVEIIFGKAVKVCRGDGPGTFIIGVVDFVDFSTKSSKAMWTPPNCVCEAMISGVI